MTELGPRRLSTCPDLSLLQKPFKTNLVGLTEVVNLFENATEEVKKYISTECKLIYECRVCESMFRSLANFIKHKRNFCNNNEPIPFDEQRDASSNETSEQITEEIMGMDLSKPYEENLENNNLGYTNRNIISQDISDLSAVGQNITERLGQNLMSNEVMEMYTIFNNNNEAILGPDGCLIPNTYNQLPNLKDSNLICAICKQQFLTRKTLVYHIKYKHNKTMLVYPCPETGCKEKYFAKTWFVLRHLMKDHGKSSNELRKLRYDIRATVSSNQDQPSVQPDMTTKTNKKVIKPKMMDLEDPLMLYPGLRQCPKCNKHFERKVALRSHYKICNKRYINVNKKRPINNNEDDDKSPTAHKKIKEDINKVGSVKYESRLNQANDNSRAKEAIDKLKILTKTQRSCEDAKNNKMTKLISTKKSIAQIPNSCEESNPKLDIQETQKIGLEVALKDKLDMAEIVDDISKTEKKNNKIRFMNTNKIKDIQFNKSKPIVSSKGSSKFSKLVQQKINKEQSKSKFDIIENQDIELNSANKRKMYMADSVNVNKSKRKKKDDSHTIVSSSLSSNIGECIVQSKYPNTGYLNLFHNLPYQDTGSRQDILKTENLKNMILEVIIGSQPTTVVTPETRSTNQEGPDDDSVDNNAKESQSDIISRQPQ